MPIPPYSRPADWQLRPLAAALVAAGLLAPATPLAATLTVDTLAEFNGGACTLRDAVHSVNAQADQGGCVADVVPGAYGVNDAIVFAPALSGTITFAFTDPLAIAGPSALSIRRPVSVHGPGSTQMTLTCGNSAYRLLEVAASMPPVAISGITIGACGGIGDGGGMLVTDQFSNAAPFVHLTDVVLSNNRTQGSAATGGGLGVVATTLGAMVTLDQCAIVGNASAGGGGIGIRASDDPAAPATVSVTGGLLSLNQAKSGGGGARIVGTGSSVQFTRSTIDQNSTNIGDGGGILQLRASATVLDSTLSNNLSNNAGGAISVQGAPATLSVTNSTISGNRASLGGGIHGRLTIVNTVVLGNSTIVANVASRGAGVMVENAFAVSIIQPGNVTATNTIIAGNVPGGGNGDIDSSVPNTWDISFSVVGQVGPNVTINGAGNITGGAVPPPFGAGGWLGPLQNNGGPTSTHELLTSVADPAIDAGDPAFSGLAYDQRGFPFTRVRGGRLDIGAFESGALDSAVAVPIPGLAGWALAALSGLLGLTGTLRRRRRPDS